MHCGTSTRVAGRKCVNFAQRRAGFLLTSSATDAQSFLSVLKVMTFPVRNLQCERRTLLSWLHGMNRYGYWWGACENCIKESVRKGLETVYVSIV